MKAILINAVESKVEVAEIENTLEAMYAKIGCEMIEVVCLGENHCLICDEEGRFRNWLMGFQLGSYNIIAGNALIVSSNDEGDFTDATVPIELFSQNITFVDLKENPLPPPRLGFAFIEGELNEKNIARARAQAEWNMNNQQ